MSMRTLLHALLVLLHALPLLLILLLCLLGFVVFKDGPEVAELEFTNLDTISLQEQLNIPSII